MFFLSNSTNSVTHTHTHLQSTQQARIQGSTQAERHFCCKVIMFFFHFRTFSLCGAASTLHLVCWSFFSCVLLLFHFGFTTFLASAQSLLHFELRCGQYFFVRFPFSSVDFDFYRFIFTAQKNKLIHIFRGIASGGKYLLLLCTAAICPRRQPERDKLQHILVSRRIAFSLVYFVVL